MELGVGLRAGLSIVAIALLIDRLSRAALDRPRRPSA
jgi:glycine betaine/proline transport system permease protein